MALDSNVELLSGSWSEEVRAESTGGLEQVTARAHAGEGARARIPPPPQANGWSSINLPFTCVELFDFFRFNFNLTDYLLWTILE